MNDYHSAYVEYHTDRNICTASKCNGFRWSDCNPFVSRVYLLFILGFLRVRAHTTHTHTHVCTVTMNSYKNINNFSSALFSLAPPIKILKLLFSLLEVRLAIYSLCTLPFFRSCLFLCLFSIDSSMFCGCFIAQLNKQTVSNISRPM